MVERIVLIKLNPDLSTPEGRADVAAQSRRDLLAVPGVRGVRAGVAADDTSARSWDVSLVVRFDAIADVEPYLRHPQHRAYVDEYLAPRMTFIKAWNFEVPEA